MLFNSLEYFLFFGFVFFYHWYIHPILFKNPELRMKALHVFLLIVSYFFYMSWDYRFGALILISTVIDYVLALQIVSTESPRKKLFLLQLSLFLNLVCILGFFKYYHFVTSNINAGLGLFGFNNPIPALNIILPVGISFFTFQSLSYTIDVYRNQIPAEKNFVKFALFVSFFPQLVAGPIVTAKSFLPQLTREVSLEEVPFRVAIRYFIMGYIKKVVLSDNVAPIVDLIFTNPENYGTTASWLGASLFIVQIYCDFSGYSDMAYGSALLLGYELPENFRMPFICVNFTDFWRRWHISLSGWLKEYLYFALGGSKKGYFRHKFNLFFTMLLAGLWHGASWNFVIWGGLQGVILAVESAYGKWKESKGIVTKNSMFLNLLFMTATMTFFTLIGTLFRTENLAKDWVMIQNMVFHFSTTGLRPYMVKTAIAVVGVLVVGHLFGYFIFEKNKKISVPAYLEYGTYVIVVLLISLFTNDNDPPFIYFQF